MNTFRNLLSLLAEGVRAQGGLLAVCLYAVGGTFLLLVTTACLLVMSIVLIAGVPVLIFLQALAWISAKLSTQNKTHSSNAEM
jgi:hypothetical protein